MSIAVDSATPLVIKSEDSDVVILQDIGAVAIGGNKTEGNVVYMDANGSPKAKDGFSYDEDIDNLVSVTFNGVALTTGGGGTNYLADDGTYKAVSAIATNHSILLNLNADDHPQYHTDARALTWLGTRSTDDLPEGSNLYYTDARADARITLQKGAVNGLATLDGSGKIPTAQIPALALGEVYEVADITARDALVVQAGDLAIVADNGSGEGETFIYGGSSWVSVKSGDDVLSVNGATGVVVLTTSDVSEGSNLYHTTARVQVVIDADTTLTKVDGSRPFTATIGGVDPVAGTDLTTRQWVEGQVAAGDFWERAGTTLSPRTAGDGISIGPATVAGVLDVTDTTASVSPGTGALVVSGGIGASGDVRTTGGLHAQDIVHFSDNGTKYGELSRTGDTVHFKGITEGLGGDPQMQFNLENSSVGGRSGTISFFSNSNNLSSGKIQICAPNDGTVEHEIGIKSTNVSSPVVVHFNKSEDDNINFRISTGSVTDAFFVEASNTGYINMGVPVNILDTTASTSTTNGSGVFAGGVGIAGDLHVGSRIAVDDGTAGSPSIYFSGDAGGDTGAFKKAENAFGISAGGNEVAAFYSNLINFQENLKIIDATSSSSSSTGALAVTGGVGIGENLHVAGDVTITGTLTGYVIGTDVQAYDAGLQSISGLTTSANKMIYTNGSDSYTTTNLTSFGRSLIDDADATAGRTTLGLGTMATETATDYAQLSGAVFTGQLDPATAGANPGGTTTLWVNSSDSNKLYFGASPVDSTSSPAGNDREIQFNNGGSFGAVTGFQLLDEVGTYVLEFPDGDDVNIRSNSIMTLQATGVSSTDVQVGDGSFKTTVSNPGGSSVFTQNATFFEFSGDHFLMNGKAGDPGVSGAGQGIFLFNSTTNSFRVSENGGAFVDVVQDLSGLQPLDSGLTSISGLTTSSDQMIYTTASDTYATTSLTAFGRSLIDDADATAGRTTLGLGTMATETATDYAQISGDTFTGAVTIAGDPDVHLVIDMSDSNDKFLRFDDQADTDEMFIQKSSGTSYNINTSTLMGLNIGIKGQESIRIQGSGSGGLYKFAVGHDYDFILLGNGAQEDYKHDYGLNTHTFAGDVTLNDNLTVNGTFGFDTGVSNITEILDEDTLVSDSATALATQQSIKAYVDNFSFTGGDVTGTGAVLSIGSGVVTEAMLSTAVANKLNDTVPHKLDATVAPDADNDVNDSANSSNGIGFEVGSLWVDVSGDEAYRCVDATDGAAVWINTTLSSSELGSLAFKNTINDSDWSGTALAVANGGTGTTTASGARTNLGLVIGTDVQAYDAGLQSIAGLTTAADQMIYTTASDTYATTSLTSFGRSLIDDADATAGRTTLGLGTMATETATDYAQLSGAVFTGQLDPATAGANPGGTTTLWVNSSDSNKLYFGASPVDSTSSPAGSEGAVQYYSGGAFAGSAQLTYSEAGITATLDATNGILDLKALGQVSLKVGDDEVRVQENFIDFYCQGNYVLSLANGSVEVATAYVNHTGTDSIAVSQAGEGRYFFDLATNKFKVSENGGAYVDMIQDLSGLQPLDSGLTSISGLTTSSDQMIYTTASDTYATTSLTAFGRSLIDDADATAGRTTLGLGTMATETAADYAQLSGDTFTGDVGINQLMNFSTYSNPSPAVGDLWFDNNQLNLVTANDARAVSTSNGTSTSDTTVSNTTTETTIATIPIPADEFHVGQAIIDRVKGRYSTANGTDTFTVRVKIGGVTVSTLTSDAGNVTDAGLAIENMFTVRTIGASGTVWSNTVGIFNKSIEHAPSTGTTTIDTTTANDITVTVQWSAAAAGNSVTFSQELVNFLG